MKAAQGLDRADNDAIAVKGKYSTTASKISTGNTESIV